MIKRDWDGLIELADTFFNKWHTDKSTKEEVVEPNDDPLRVTLSRRLIERGTSVIRVGDRHYRVVITEIEP